MKEGFLGLKINDRFHMVRIISCCFIILFFLEGCLNRNSERTGELDSSFQRIDKVIGKGRFEINYFKNGQFNSIESYQDDSLQGFSYSFYENGNLYERAEFQAGKRIKNDLIYHENGMLAFYRFFVKPGKVAYQRAYKNGKVVKEEGGFVVLEPQKIYKEEGDSLLSIQVTTIIPPDCFDVTTNIKVIDEMQSVVDSVQLVNQKEFVYNLLLDDRTKSLMINCTLHESFMDSVTIFKFVSYKRDLLKMFEKEKK